MAGMQKQEVDRMRALLVDAITTLCRSGLRYTRDMRVEGLIGITLDEADVILVNVNKTFETALKEKEKEEATPKKDVDGRRGSADETTPSKRRRQEKEDDIIIDRVIPPRKDTMGFGSPSAKRMRGNEHSVRQSPHKPHEKGPAQMMWTEVNRTTPQKHPGTPQQSPSGKNRSEMKIEILSSDEEDADGRKIKKSRIGRRAILPSNVHLTSQLNQLVTGPPGSTVGTTVIQVGQSPGQIRQIAPVNVGNQYQQAQFQQTFPPEAVQCDKVNRSLLVASKVRACVRCSRCKKARCVYSTTRLSKNQMIYLQNMIKKGEYICGRALVTGPDQSMVVRRSQDCRSPMETAYYGAPSVSFPQCCYYCGTTQNLLNDSYMKDLQARYASVRPLCAPCRKQGKLARTWGHKLPMEGGRPMNVLPPGAVIQQGTVMQQFQRNPPVPVAIRMASPAQAAPIQMQQQASTPSPLPSATSSTPSPLTAAPAMGQPVSTPGTPSSQPSSTAGQPEQAGEAGKGDSPQAEENQEQGDEENQEQGEEQRDAETAEEDGGQDPQQSDAQSSSDAGQAEDQQGETSSTPTMTPQREDGNSPQEVPAPEGSGSEPPSVGQQETGDGQGLSEADKLQPDQLTAEFQRIISESQKVILDPIFIKPDIHVQQTQEFVEVSELARSQAMNGTPLTTSMQQPNTPPPPTCTSPGVGADALSADLNALSPLQIEPSGDGVWPEATLPGSPSPTSMEQEQS